MVPSWLLYLIIVVCMSKNNMARKKAKMISSEVARIEEVPYQVALQKYRMLSCGGTIINRYFVVTAAHCVMDSNILFNKDDIATEVSPEYLRVKVGTTEGMATANGIIHQIDKIAKHHLYKKTSNKHDYDIAVIKVLKEFKFSSKVQPVKLITEEPTDKTMSAVSGYGSTTEKRFETMELRKALIPVMSRERCKKKLAKFNRSKITDNNICAGYDKSHRDACQGDSGGPMVVNKRLAGVVSWGIGCGREGVPGIYISIAKFRTWIHQMMKKLMTMT